MKKKYNNIKQYFNKGVSTTAGILIVVSIAIVAGGLITWQMCPKEEVPTPSPTVSPTPTTTPTSSSFPTSTSPTGDASTTDETANWKIYTNEELEIRFRYPYEWESPIIKEIGSVGKCNYKEVYFLGKGGIHMRSKTESAFICYDPEPYFECGDYYFVCSPPLSSFNCQPYKDEIGNYDHAKIWSDLKSQGFDCGTSVGRDYAPFIYNPELLQKQFQILEKASQAVKLDKILEEEIKSDFILFRPFMVGSDNRFYVGLIYNSQIEAQGIKMIGYDGSDVDAYNYYYRAVFLKDNKIISARFSLFSNGLLEWANNEMFQTKQGKNFQERIIEAVEDKNKESQIYEIVREYDLLAKYINFIF